MTLLSPRKKQSWIYFLPGLHLCACLFSMVGLVIPPLQFLGRYFSFLLIADLPVSILTIALLWRYSTFAWVWILVAGTLWWYLLSRCADVLFSLIRHDSYRLVPPNKD